MAYTSAPETQTYSSPRIPIAHNVYQRNNGGYTTMKNLIPFKETNSSGEEVLSCKTRQKIVTSYAINTASVTRGLYVWEKEIGTIYYFLVVGTSVYTATAAGGPYTAVTTLSTGVTTPVRFTEFISSTNTKSLVLVDGVQGFVFTTNAAGTEITDADFPTPHVPFPVFLNGRLHLADAGTGDIYCSDLDDPAAWTAGNFISSEVYPDGIQALLKINNYILAVGTNGSEFFYDAAIPTGSPLQRDEGGLLPFGTLHPNSIAYTNDTACLLTRDQAGELSLRVIEGMKYKEIPAPHVIYDMRNLTSSFAANIRGYFFRQEGRLYYGIARDGTVNNNDDFVSYFHHVYSFETEIWVEFTRGRNSTFTTGGGVFTGEAHKTYPVYFAANGTTSNPSTYVAGMTYNSAFIGYLSSVGIGADELTLDGVSGSYWYLSAAAPPTVDFGTRNIKFMHRLGLDYTNIYDSTLASASARVGLTPHIQWTESGTSASSYSETRMLFEQIDAMTGTDIPYAFLTQLGAFRRRDFSVLCYGGLIFRYIEFDINKGQQ